MTLDPQNLPLADVARLLSRAGGRPVTEETLREAARAGLPLKAGNRIDIFVLAAWLNRELAHARILAHQPASPDGAGTR